MSDVVVTVPMRLWDEWLEEGNLAGEPWDGQHENHFWLPNNARVRIEPGERVYVVAHGKLRGYSPLVRTERRCRLNLYSSCLLRRNDAVAVTIAEPIRGFQGFRYRWWARADEVPFPDWRKP